MLAPNEPLIKTGRKKLELRMIRIKSENASNSSAVTKLHNEEIGYFGLKLTNHNFNQRLPGFLTGYDS
jgi:hypothetical protein